MRGGLVSLDSGVADFRLGGQAFEHAVVSSISSASRSVVALHESSLARFFVSSLRNFVMRLPSAESLAMANVSTL